jgi:hypothetical protein
VVSYETNRTELAGLTVTFYTCSGGVRFGSRPSCWLSWLCVGFSFPRSLQKNSGTALQLGHDHFLSNSSFFYNSTYQCHSVRYWKSTKTTLLKKRNKNRSACYLVTFLVRSSALNMEAVRSSEMSANFYRTTRRYISEDSTFHSDPTICRILSTHNKKTCPLYQTRSLLGKVRRLETCICGDILVYRGRNSIIYI